MTERLSGRVKMFKPERGFGFIVSEAIGEDVFVHVIDTRKTGIENLDPDQAVTFEIERNGDRGIKAINVQLEV